VARVEPRTPLAAYVHARTAASAGALEQASAGFAAAIDNAPDNGLVAAQALAHGVTAGDWPLSLRAAATLERLGELPPDARFLLVADAFRSGDWRAARRHVDAVERERLFAFAAPVLRAWLAHGSGQGDPLAALPEAAGGAATAYAAEHRPLLLAAAGRPEAARLMLEGQAEGGARGLRLRLAAAGALARRGERAAALALLEGEEAPLAVGRRLIAARRPVPGAVATAPAGVAELMLRIALDLNAQELTAVAASFARLATFAAPDNSHAWMIAAELLAEDDRRDLAVALLDNVAAADPFAEAARDQRIRLLLQAGEGERAQTLAEAAAAAPGASAADLVRLGEVLLDRERADEAARAFERALELRAGDESAPPEWALWLFRGGAHDEAGDWPAAKAALEQAYRLAPGQPLVLNYLGYAQLERRENMEEAERLVREAHRLAPDNAAITDSLGWALFLKGEIDEAVALLELAVEGAPADVEINEHLGDAYYSAGRRLEARYAWAAARVYAEGEAAARLDAKIEAGLTPQLAAR